MISFVFQLNLFEVESVSQVIQNNVRLVRYSIRVSISLGSYGDPFVFLFFLQRDVYFALTQKLAWYGLLL